MDKEDVVYIYNGILCSHQKNVNTFYMLQRRGRKSLTPTMVQCTEDPLREDYTHGQMQLIHLFFCFLIKKKKKWGYSVASCMIGKCKVKINLLTVVQKQFGFVNYIGIYL